MLICTMVMMMTHLGARMHRQLTLIHGPMLDQPDEIGGKAALPRRENGPSKRCLA